MKYLPILQELFESDTYVFLIIGIVIAVIVGLRLNNQKNYIMGIIISVAIYALCELASNIHTNYMSELILLFGGTVAIGCGIGFIICFLLRAFKVNKES